MRSGWLSLIRCGEIFFLQSFDVHKGVLEVVLGGPWVGIEGSSGTFLKHIIYIHIYTHMTK